MKYKNQYRDLCQTEKEIPVFSQDWWLDTVVGPENWNVVCVEKNKQLIACLPYTIKTYFSFKIAKMPALTPMLYPWIDFPPDQKESTKRAYERKLLSELAEKIPHFPRFHQKYHYALTNWLPFYWAGYKQTTRYSYIIDDLTSSEKIFMGFKSNIRRAIRKAEKLVRINETEDPEKFYELNKMTFERQEEKITYSLSFISKLDSVTKSKKCRKIFLAEDPTGRIHAALYLVWDKRSAYYLMGGVNPDLKSSGASTLLMWHAIQFASTVSKKFDFEGSMIKSLEHYFQSFGAIQKPYFSIYKNNKFVELVSLLLNR